MQKLMSAKVLSRREMKLIKGAGEPVGGGGPGGNNNPPKGGNKCFTEPRRCSDPQWMEWMYCVGKDLALQITTCVN
jgi:hypothetical protein